MLLRVRAIFFTRNPYRFGDVTWRLMSVPHELAGGGFIALAMVHAYFAARPQKRDITTSMIFGLAASMGASISMGFTEALSVDRSLTGHGHP